MNSQSKMKKDHESKVQRDIETVSQFIRIYCKHNHRQQAKAPVRTPGRIKNYLNDSSVRLCRDCRKLLLYAASKRMICPYDPKPSCKRCSTHCYTDGFREAIREVMRFSGLFLIKRGKLGLIKRYLF